MIGPLLLNPQAAFDPNAWDDSVSAALRGLVDEQNEIVSDFDGACDQVEDKLEKLDDSSLRVDPDSLE
jgi:hypothetical protein